MIYLISLMAYLLAGWAFLRLTVRSEDLDKWSGLGIHLLLLVWPIGFCCFLLACIEDQFEVLAERLAGFRSWYYRTIWGVKK